MSLLEKFGYKKDDFAIVLEQPDLFSSSAKTTKIVVGEATTVAGSINGIAVPTTILVKDANWSRLTVRDHIVNRQDEEPRVTQVFGGVFNNFVADVTVQVDGTEMALYDLMKQFIVESFGKGLSDDKINEMLNKNLSLNGLRNGGPLMFQQMGASEAGIAHAVETFRSAGGVDDMRSVANSPSFNTAYKMPEGKTGLELVSFELGTSDRKLSKTGQGFVDIVSAITENFERVVKHKTVASVLKAELDANLAKLSQDEIKLKQAKIEAELNMAKDYVNCWSGAARQTKIVNGKKQIDNKYNAVNAPCGRWSVLVDNAIIDLDVWSNTTKAPAKTVDTQVAEIANAEEPF
jgi:hypothetical protein